MSILFFEGFDTYGTDTTNIETGIGSREEVWGGGVSEWSAECVTASRNNGLTFSPTSGASTATPTVNYSGLFRSAVGDGAIPHAIAGIAALTPFNFYSNDDGPTILSFYGENLSNSQLYQLAWIKLWPNGSLPNTFKAEIKAYNTSSVFIDNLADGVWHYYEMEFDSQSVGNVWQRVWINGGLVSERKLTTSSIFDCHRVGMSGAFGADASEAIRIHYDDMYFLDAGDDSQGAQFQSRLGPIQIRPVPLTSDGLTSSWTASSGGAKFQDVDEQPGPNDLDATYISTGAAPQTQLFRATAHDAELPIIAVTTFASVKQPDPTTGIAKIAIMADDQEDIKPGVLQGIYRTFSQNYVTLPGGALSVPVIEATEFGVRSIEGT